MSTVFLQFFLGIVFLIGPLSLCADIAIKETPKLQDIPKVMNDIMKYHISIKKMDPTLMRNVINRYIEQFDPYKVYLLQEEVDFLTDISDSKIDEIISEYNQGRFPYFAVMVKKMQEAIERVRGYRERFFSSGVLAMQQKIAGASSWKVSTTYAKTERELEKRHIKYIASIASQTVKPDTEDLEAAIKNTILSVEDVENKYLYRDMHGKPFTKEHQEDVFAFGLLKAFIGSLDNHSALLDPKEALALRKQLNKGIDDFGIVIREEEGKFFIDTIFQNISYSQGKQLSIGDEVVQIDGRSLKGKPLYEVIDLIEKSKNKLLTLDVRRNNVLYKVILKSLSESNQGKRVTSFYKEISDGIIGYIVIPSFYQGDNDITTSYDVRREIEQLKSHGKIRALVIDLRNNLGGFLMEAVKVAGFFIKSGVVVTAQYGDGSCMYYRDLDPSVLYDGPVVLLVSRNTASSSEILTEALKDYGVAVVVGNSRTYGKGSIQMQTITKEQNTMPFFKVTIGHYYSPDNESIDGTGITPDILFLGAQTKSNHEELVGVSKDTLKDISSSERRWYEVYYVPFIQEPTTRWRKEIDRLKKRSVSRIQENKQYRKLAMEANKTPEEKELFSQIESQEAMHVAEDLIKN